MNPNQTDDRPECFARLEKVFPMGADDLREVSGECWDCPQRVPCLKQAINTGEGSRDIAEDQGRREQEHVGGAAGFLRRWNRLKTHDRRGGK